ncbi:hypothetical protein BDW74DRAFT_158493 [Aspergillus multicolor]|uniref:uncharacterized protein n=1 Tax=Aspergillus multicolor TaxID=41759 RepID=UPI003CCE2D27
MMLTLIITLTLIVLIIALTPRAYLQRLLHIFYESNDYTPTCANAQSYKSHLSNITPSIFHGTNASSFYDPGYKSILGNTQQPETAFNDSVLAQYKKSYHECLHALAEMGGLVIEWVWEGIEVRQ